MQQSAENRQVFHRMCVYRLMEMARSIILVGGRERGALLQL
jgi:hypothetical protein